MLITTKFSSSLFVNENSDIIGSSVHNLNPPLPPHSLALYKGGGVTSSNLAIPSLRVHKKIFNPSPSFP